VVEIKKDLLNGAVLTVFRPSPEYVKMLEKVQPTVRHLDYGKGNYLLYADFYEAILDNKLELKITKIDGKTKPILVLKKNFWIGRDIDYFLDPKDLSIHSFLKRENGEILHKKVMSTNLKENVDNWNAYLRDSIQSKNIEIIQKIIKEFKEKIPTHVKETIATKLKNARTTIKPKIKSKQKLCPKKTEALKRRLK
jgi:hypothetical protein